MVVIQMLPMIGGTGEKSYANNSMLQRNILLKTKLIKEQAITELYLANFSDNLCIADLGCSSGPNTFLVVSQLIKTVDAICKKLERNKSPEFQVYLNDLPSNDFNNVFRSLPLLQDNLKEELGPGFGPCFFTGVPGSFYDRLFPTNSVHFIHSSYCLHWLSKVPQLIETNKSNFYMASTSPARVRQAYHEQFQEDFCRFLDYRGQEMVVGGRMVLTFMGRRSDDASTKECYFFDLLAMALRQMLSKELIEEEELDSFNIPFYAPSAKEVKAEVEKDGSFSIDRLETFEVNWDPYADNESNLPHAVTDGGSNVAKCHRAVMEPMLVSHFGDGIIDEVFERYRVILSNFMAKEESKYFNVIVSMTRKG